MTRKKLLALLTVATLSSSLLAPSTATTSQAATTLKITNVTKNKKTMYVGSRFTLKTNVSKSKLTYKSTKTAIAVISKKGVIKAKKAGKCTIKVTAKLSKSKKVTKKIKLTVKKKTTTTATSTPVVATQKPTSTALATNTPNVATATPTVKPTNIPTNTPAPTATATNTPTITATPVTTTTPTKTPTSTTQPTQTPVATSTPTVTTQPAVTGTVTISSIHFEENGLTLSDANGHTVSPSDAANLYVDGTTVTIVAPTTNQEIAVSGTCQQGQIRINVDKTTYPDGEVDLSFENLTLSNTLTSPVYVQAIDGSVNISLKKGTKNTLSDGDNYTNEDKSNGVIYSKDDLKIKGKGSLVVTGNCGYGIITKNDLKIYNGSITVTSKDVCLKGKDSVKIGNKDDLEKDGAYDNLILNLTSSASDCVRSNNPIDDASKATEDSDYADGKEGTIVINGGKITANAYADAFQSNGTLTVNGGTLDLHTYEGSSYANTSDPTTNWNGTMPGNWNGNMPGNSTDNSKQKLDISAKGLKSEGDMTINGGTIIADTSDDALHCGGKLVINNGTLTLSTGDDAVHSDTSLEVNGGTIEVSKCYEGLEGTSITINDGTIHIVSSDDGINAAGGNTNSTWNNFPGFGNSTSNTNYSMTINGGYILVEASGDGLDSNGSLTITGGTTLVLGPTSGADNAFDCDGTFSCTGGIALGLDSYNQMSRFPSNTTNYLTRSISGSNTSGSNAIAITDKNGTILSYITYSTSASSLTYYNGAETASDLKVYLNPTFSGTTDAFGYASTGTVSGGTELTESSNSGGNNNQFPGGNNRPRH